MNDIDKIKIVDRIVELISESYVGEDMPVMVGVLNSPQGINGFYVAPKGHPVFEIKDRYVIYLESSTPEKIAGHGKETIFRDFKVSVPYYKETLRQCIDFIPKDS